MFRSRRTGAAFASSRRPTSSGSTATTACTTASATAARAGAGRSSGCRPSGWAVREPGGRADRAPHSRFAGAIGDHVADLHATEPGANRVALNAVVPGPPGERRQPAWSAAERESTRRLGGALDAAFDTASLEGVRTPGREARAPKAVPRAPRCPAVGLRHELPATRPGSHGRNRDPNRRRKRQSSERSVGLLMIERRAGRRISGGTPDRRRHCAVGPDLGGLR